MPSPSAKILVSQPCITVAVVAVGLPKIGTTLSRNGTAGGHGTLGFQ